MTITVWNNWRQKWCDKLFILDGALYPPHCNLGRNLFFVSKLSTNGAIRLQGHPARVGAMVYRLVDQILSTGYSDSSIASDSTFSGTMIKDDIQGSYKQ